jgi:hypothetical protein
MCRAKARRYKSMCRPEGRRYVRDLPATNCRIANNSGSNRLGLELKFGNLGTKRNPHFWVRRRDLRSAKRLCLIIFVLLGSAVAVAAKDTKDYPLKVEILWNKWERYRPYPVREPETFFYRVDGQGNVMDGSMVHAIDFKYGDIIVARVTAVNQTYPARWKKPQRELEVQIPEIGHEGKYQTVSMDITVREGVYLGRGQGVHEVSQADYAARKAPPATNAATQAPEQAATLAKVSVTSNPASAEIEVDGEFTGMTPSVFELSVGEHTIALHKAGYKPWQRKMKVVEGDVNMNADLEPATPN